MVQLLLIPVLYFLGVKLSLLFAATPDVLVMLWMPNSLVLAALLRYGFRRYWLFAMAILSAEVAADFPTFSLAESLLFGLINVAEATLAYLLLRRWRFDPAFKTPMDIAKFVAAGPIIAAFLAASAAGGVYEIFRGHEATYVDFVRVWWFSDGLGVLILTPVILTLWAPQADGSHRANGLRWYDAAILAAGAMILLAFALSNQGQFYHLTIRPILLMPLVVYVAIRFSLRWATACVLVTALALIYLTKIGEQPFGPLDFRATALSTQEFIATMSLIALGLNTLLAQHRANARELERRVREQTAELREANSKLERLALTDALTGLPNRRALLELLPKEMERCSRMHDGLALIMFDVDHFKRVNDLHGHAAGDLVLQRVAAEVSSVVRSMDTLTRYGGEEFVLLAPGIESNSAVQLAERMRSAINGSEVTIGAHRIPVTASFGIAMIVGDERCPEDLLRRADRAMYAAKSAGRDCVIAEGAQLEGAGEAYNRQHVGHSAQPLDAS